MKKIVLSIAYLFFVVSFYAQDNKVELCKDFVFQCNYITSIVNKNVSIDKQKEFFTELKEAKSSESYNSTLSKYLQEDKELYLNENENLFKISESLKIVIVSEDELENILTSNSDIIYPPIAYCADLSGYNACMSKPNSTAIKRAIKHSASMWAFIRGGATAGATFGPEGIGFGALLGTGFGLWMISDDVIDDTNEWAREQADCWSLHCNGSKGTNKGPGMPGGGPKWYPPVNY